MLWRAEGYCRLALHRMAPGLFPQRRFLEQLEFRTERDLFVQSQQQPVVEAVCASGGEVTR
jgi:hypothetical protein